MADKYIQTWQKTPSVKTRTRKPHTKYLTPSNIEKSIKLLRCTFKQSVRWEMIGKNPFDTAICPKVEYKRRDIWDSDMIRKALDTGRDSKLYMSMVI